MVSAMGVLLQCVEGLTQYNRKKSQYVCVAAFVVVLRKAYIVIGRGLK